MVLADPRELMNFAKWEFSEIRMVRILGGCGHKPQDKRRRPYLPPPQDFRPLD